MKYRIDILEKSYPIGSRVELINLDDPYSRLIPGIKGTVTCVDSIGTIHVKWDNGSMLGIIPGIDSIRLIDGDK